MPFKQALGRGMELLTIKQRAFVEAYTGDGTAAARAAGYRDHGCNCRLVASQLMRNPVILKAILDRDRIINEPLIRSRLERQRWWVEMMQNEEADPRDRVRASELLAKSCGDFADTTINKTLNVTQPIMVILGADDAPLPLPANCSDAEEASIVDAAHRIATDAGVSESNS